MAFFQRNYALLFIGELIFSRYFNTRNMIIFSDFGMITSPEGGRIVSRELINNNAIFLLLIPIQYVVAKISSNINVNVF